eukprot:2131081-Rhodomonas_salina.1
MRAQARSRRSRSDLVASTSGVWEVERGWPSRWNRQAGWVEKTIPPEAGGRCGSACPFRRRPCGARRVRAHIANAIPAPITNRTGNRMPNSSPVSTPPPSCASSLLGCGVEIEATGLEKVTPAMPIPRATVSSPELTLLPSVTMASASASDAARMRKSSERASKRLLVVDTETMMTRCGSMPSCAAISTANCCLTLSVMSFTVSGPPIVIDISTAGPGTTMNSLE